VNDSIFIELDNIGARNSNQPVFQNTNWQLRVGQQWAIIGPNGSGKSTFANLLDRHHPLSSGVIHYPENFDPKTDIAIVSFEEQYLLCARDQKLDMSEYSASAFDVGTTVANTILQGLEPNPHFAQLLKDCSLEGIQDRGIRFISSGEMRKTLIAKALFNKPRLLILDNPFEALDADSREHISELIDELLLSDLPVLLLCKQQQDILKNITHLMIVENCQISAAGPIEEIKQTASWSRINPELPPLPDQLPERDKSQQSYQLSKDTPLIQLENVSVCYGEDLILDHVSWTMEQGQHTAIVGPNGAGKTTLLNLVTGENPRAYGQEVWLCGNKRGGGGESIWEVKQKLGLVSNGLQQSYTRATTIFDVVASGFFDTIGLYDKCSPTQQDIAKQWLNILELSDKAEVRYDSLSFGEQRLVLLARAMIKSPLILILDEPCSGLDDYHRRLILRLIDFIAAQSTTHMIYVSHHAEEQPDCINQRLRFVPKEDTGYELRCDNLL